MKCNFKGIRLNVYIILLVSLALSAFCDVKSPKANPYKDDKNVHNSLFNERDSGDRMSSLTQGIPQPKNE